MDCATGMRRIIQEIDRKTKANCVNITPARKCKFSSGITVNFHRREHLNHKAEQSIHFCSISLLFTFHYLFSGERLYLD